METPNKSAVGEDRLPSSQRKEKGEQRGSEIIIASVDNSPREKKETKKNKKSKENLKEAAEEERPGKQVRKEEENLKKSEVEMAGKKRKPVVEEVEVLVEPKKKETKPTVKTTKKNQKNIKSRYG